MRWNNSQNLEAAWLGAGICRHLPGWRIIKTLAKPPPLTSICEVTCESDTDRRKINCANRLAAFARLSHFSAEPSARQAAPSSDSTYLDVGPRCVFHRGQLAITRLPSHHLFAAMAGYPGAPIGPPGTFMVPGGLQPQPTKAFVLLACKE
jgi:hypothetical protein